MGSITARKRKDGKTAYMAQIVIKQGGAIIHRENKTFPARREAAGWIARREEDLALGVPQYDAAGPVLADVIDRYTNESRRALGRTKTQVLRTIKGMPIGAMRCGKIGSADVIAMANALGATVLPQTVQNYLSHLSAVFAIARPAWGYPLDRQAMQDAFVVAKRLGVTSKSRQRDRRPSIAELDNLLGHFTAVRAKRTDSNPMADIVLFALFSTRRQEEITRITWADYDAEHARVLVRDLKHPGEKIGNDQWCDLPPEAVAVLERQPRITDRIFPAAADTISASFTRACMLLGITADDMPVAQRLHFHDLRHDGISRLFELGWSIPHVAAVSGHRSWQSLKRYTHIRQRGDKYAGWQWLPAKEKAQPKGRAKDADTKGKHLF